MRSKDAKARTFATSNAQARARSLAGTHLPPEPRAELVPGGDEARIGAWRVLDTRFAHLPVHMAVLPTGKVLAFGGSGNDPPHLRDPHPAEILDLETETIHTVPQRLDGDLFCAGHAFLADGRLLVAGGTYGYPLPLIRKYLPLFAGLEQAYAFDPWTESWTRLPDMSRGRWYPTLITLGDGRVLAVAGLTKHFPWVFLRRIEVYTPGAGWSRLPNASRGLPLYPRLHLLPDGAILYSGSYNTHLVFPFLLRKFPTAVFRAGSGWETIGAPGQPQREEGACVLLPLKPGDPGKVLLVGGGDRGGTTGVRDAEVLDLGQRPWRWRAVEPMKWRRYYAYAVTLPTGEVLVCGGREGKHDPRDHAAGHPEAIEGEVPPDPLAVYEPELFDPATNSWTTLAPMSVDRLYHANALLLPDGRVLMAGSNPPNRFEPRIEVFSPPYLFRGPRPEIASVPPTVGYDHTLVIGIPPGDPIDRVVLMRPSATTHCLDTEQRHVTLPFEEVGSTTLQAQVPSNRNLLPPGYYMLFLVRDGIPSKASFVHVG